METLEFDFDNINWTCYKFGRGRPLFLIPAFHSDFGRFKSLLDLLAEYFTIYFPELPGIGTNESLGSKHTCLLYAKYLKRMLKVLNLKNYVLCGLCLGAVIALRMIQDKKISPMALFFVEALTDGEYIHVERVYRPLLNLIIKNGSRSKIINNIADFGLHNKTLLNLVFRLAFWNEKNLDEIVKHQIDLTDQMNTRAWLDIVEDLFQLSLSRENLRFDIPAILAFNRLDNLIDSEKTIKEIVKILPRSKVTRFDMPRHAPPGPISKSSAEELISPLLPDLKALSANRKLEI